MITSLTPKMQDLADEILEYRYAFTEKAYNCCCELLKMAQRENAPYFIAFAHNYLGNYFISQNNCAQGGEHLSIAKQICLENEFLDLLPRVYNLYGICYEALGDKQSSVQNYLSALHLANDTNDYFSACVLYNNIANIFEGLNDFEQAKEYFQKSCDMLDKISLQTDLSYIKLRVWSNFAHVYGILGEPTQMQHYFNICSQLDDDEIAVLLEHTLARGWCSYYAIIGDADAAEQHALNFLKCYETHDYFDKTLTYEMLVKICRTLISLKKQEAAKQFLDLIFKSLRANEYDDLLQAEKLKVEYCVAFGNHHEQRDAYEEYYTEISLFERNAMSATASGILNCPLCQDKFFKNIVTL